MTPWKFSPMAFVFLKNRRKRRKKKQKKLEHNFCSLFKTMFIYVEDET